MNEIEAYYDAFSQRFINDIARGNSRIDRQLEFFACTIPRDAQSVLVLGFGSGQSVHFIAERLTRYDARVVGLDLSAENVRFAETLYPHPRVRYRQADLTTQPLDDTYDVVVLPDVYEHIPVSARPPLHAQIARILTQTGGFS